MSSDRSNKRVISPQSNKRDYNLISGLEEREIKNKRIRSYVNHYFKSNLQSFFLEWDKRQMMLENHRSWAYPKTIRKISVILNFNVSKKKIMSKKKTIPNTKDILIDKSDDVPSTDQIDFSKIKNARILIDEVHSPLEQLKNYQSKKTKSNQRKQNYYILLMSIHNHNIEKDIPEDDIHEINKSFNKDKNKISFDERLYNLLFYLIESIINKDNKYKICVKQKNFLQSQIVEKILPKSHKYITTIYDFND